MRYSLTRSSLAALFLATGLGAATFAGGPYSRTAPHDPAAVPHVDLSAICPLHENSADDETPAVAAADDDAALRLNLGFDEGDDPSVVESADVPRVEEDAAPWDGGSIRGIEVRAVAPVEVQEEQLSPRLAKLRDKVRATLAHYNAKRLNTRDHNPWEVMHSIVAYGASSHLSRGGPDGEPVNAISWLCWNGDCKGTRILEVNGKRVAARKGPQVQGHPGQFLAILAQSSITTDCPIKVGDKRFTLADLIESEKLGCEAGTELTFKLISFSYYLDIDARWKNAAGQDWSIARVVHEELKQPIVGAACGGSHRLMGFAYAVRKREASGLPMTGEFLRAKKYLDSYHRYTLTKLHNADGSFSTEWFKAPGARPDLGRRIQTSGHILEWLSYSLPAEQLQDPQVVKAVEYLTGVLYDGKDSGWEIGPLGHALHSLAIYDSRVFKPLDAPREENNVAESSAPQELPRDVVESAERTSPAAPVVTPARVGRRDTRPQIQTPRSSRRPPSTRP